MKRIYPITTLSRYLEVKSGVGEKKKLIGTIKQRYEDDDDDDFIKLSGLPERGSYAMRL